MNGYRNKICVLFLITMVLLMSYTSAGLYLTKTEFVDERQSDNDTYKVHGYVKFKSNNKPLEGIKVGEIARFPGEVEDKYDITNSEGYYCIEWEKRPYLIDITCDQGSLPKNYTFNPQHVKIIWGQRREVQVSFRIVSRKSKENIKIDAGNSYFLILNNYFKLLHKILNLDVF